MEEGRSAFKILTGKPTGKRLLGRPMRGWKDNIRLDLREIGVRRTGFIRLRKVSPSEYGTDPPSSISHGASYNNNNNNNYYYYYY